MATQVKFYSTSEFSSTQNAGGIYFVGGEKVGELYKGTQRFGAARVTSVADTTARDALTGMIRGDIAICTSGGAFVYDGTSWKGIGPDMNNILPEVSFGGDGSIITTVSQGKNGAITATAIAFPELTTGDDDGEVKLNGVNAKVSGWDSAIARISAVESSAANLESRVSAIETVVTAGEDSTVTAKTGTFTNLTTTNLTVSDTATFNATTVTASSLAVADEAQATFGGSTISQIVGASIAELDADKDATGTAEKGGVFALTGVTQTDGVITGVDSSVELEQTANKDVSITTAIATENNHYPTSKAVQDYVTTKMSDIVKPMNFLGVKESLDKVTDPKNGDVVIIGTKEYVYDSAATGTNKWVELGDESEIGELVTFTGYDKTNPLTTTAKTLAGAVNEHDAELGTITATAMGTTATTVSGAIKELKDDIAGLDATVTSDDAQGVTVKVVETDGKITDVEATVDKVDTIAATGATSSVKLATETGVRSAIDALDAEQSSTDNASIVVKVTEVDGKITTVNADLVWLDASGTAIA